MEVVESLILLVRSSADGLRVGTTPLAEVLMKSLTVEGAGALVLVTRDVSFQMYAQYGASQDVGSVIAVADVRQHEA